MQNIENIFLAEINSLGTPKSHNFFRIILIPFFMTKIGFVSLQFMSCKIDILLWSNFGFATHDDRVGSCSMPNMEGVFSATTDTSFGDLSLSHSFSPVEEHRQILEGEESEEIVELNQFESHW